MSRERSLLDSAKHITRQILVENLRDLLEEPSTPAEDVPLFEPFGSKSETCPAGFQQDLFSLQFYVSKS